VLTSPLPAVQPTHTPTPHPATLDLNPWHEHIRRLTIRAVHGGGLQRELLGGTEAQRALWQSFRGGHVCCALFMVVKRLSGVLRLRRTAVSRLVATAQRLQQQTFWVEFNRHGKINLPK
jgi:hypothetical protein